VWSFRRTAAAEDTIRYMLDHGNWPASRRQTLEAFVSDESLRSHQRLVLMEAPYAAFRWETPSLTETSADAPFELVLIDDPPLDRPADLQAFVEHFTDEPVTVFPSFGGDATLIVPCAVTNSATTATWPPSYEPHRPNTTIDCCRGLR